MRSLVFFQIIFRQAHFPTRPCSGIQDAAAVVAYQKNLTDYHAAAASSNTQTLDSLFTETYNTTQSINATVKAGKDLFNYVSENYPVQENGSQALPIVASTLQNNFSTYTSTMSSVVSDAQSNDIHICE